MLGRGIYGHEIIKQSVVQISLFTSSSGPRYAGFWARFGLQAIGLTQVLHGLSRQTFSQTFPEGLSKLKSSNHYVPQEG